jgi:uncharacterized oligopeptide transporter (OPT) family protein
MGSTDKRLTREVQSTARPGIASDQIYQPQPGELQLTVRAIACGCIMGGLLAGMNIYLGLKTGWSEPGSLVAAILGFGLFSALRPARPFTPLEANITQTAGSAAGSMASAAGFLAPIPAMTMIGEDISVAGLFFWALTVGYIGVFFAVPLRRQYILVEKLRFPTGTATAQTIVAMFGSAAETLRKSRALVATGAIAGGFTLLTYFVRPLAHPPIEELGIPLLTTLAAWQFSVVLSPLMLGAGILIGPRVTGSLLAGAIVSWGLLGPLAQSYGWAPGAIMSFHDGPRGWILWPGVAIMVGDAIMSLGLSWRTFVRTLMPARKDSDEPALEDPAQAIPTRWWVPGLAISSTAVTVVAAVVFGIPVYQTILAIVLSAVLAAVAVRSSGETDINPIGGMGKVTQLVYGGIAPGAMGTNLMAAAITGAGASQAGDMMHDLKAGAMLGASPRRQLIAQLCGVLAGVCFAVPIYLLFDSVYEIGGPEMPAPAAGAWAAVAKLLAKGPDALPAHAAIAVVAGLAFGALIPILRKVRPGWAPVLPSGLAVGIAFIVPPFYSIAMFVGALLFLAWQRKSPASAAMLGFSVASGCIAGEGLMGIVKAAMERLGVPPLL